MEFEHRGLSAEHRGFIKRVRNEVVPPPEANMGTNEIAGEINGPNTKETSAEMQYKDTADLLRAFVLVAQAAGKWNSLQSAREEMKYIKEKALAKELTGQLALVNAETKDFVYTGQNIKINAEDRNIGDVVKGEFALMVVADKNSKDYGRYLLTPLNEDARRLV